MTILERLKDAKVFCVRKSETGKGFILTERCDQYYKLSLCKRDLKKLAQELIELAESSDIEDVDFEPKEM